eukprot:TRINITY_DN12856_c0_g1_i1.p1 TRINITY_DN12856_c0_g1~~TRINITY_DN12856_c0_g1_i1.p1  ORF type:complete len:134 (+),score=21.52 TRINITY_DN12856_c0_g1_i1:32-403(+)
MGVGYPIDLVVCSALGCDMYDCVYPCRTARFGTAMVPEGLLKIKNKQYRKDFSPLDSTCGCVVCKSYTRAALHSIVTRELIGAELMTIHNLSYLKTLMNNIQKAMKDNVFPEFVNSFLKNTLS